MKKFLIKITYTILPLWLAIVCCALYLTFYVAPNASGDLGRLELIPFGNDYNAYLNKSMIQDTLFQTISNADSLETIYTDVLTIGDSFSQQKKGGFQNYLAQKGLKITNVDSRLYANMFQYTYNILDQTEIDSTNTPIIIVECVERYSVGNFLHFDTSKMEQKRIIRSGVTTFSISRVRDFVFYRTGRVKPVGTADLDTDLFTTDNPKRLYFLKEDIHSGNITKENEDKIRYVYDILCERAQNKGIKLLFLIAVDKYDLYQSHIVNNQYPPKTINEDLERILKDKPNILLSKYCLKPLVDDGVKDVFMYNDTHWSHIGSKVVADEMFQIINRGSM